MTAHRLLIVRVILHVLWFLLGTALSPSAPPLIRNTIHLLLH